MNLSIDSYSMRERAHFFNHVTFGRAQDNGFNPTFSGPALGPFDVPDAELALLRLCVFDDDVGRDRLAAAACFPVAALRQGVRSVPLNDPASGAALPLAAALCQFHLHPF